MRTLSRVCRCAGGMLAIVAGGALLGCSEKSDTILGEPVSINSTMDLPAAATADDYARATVKPANPDDAVATLSAPEISASDGLAISSLSNSAKFDITANNTMLGSLPLVNDGARMHGTETAVLPEGECVMRLSPDAELETSNIALPVTRKSRRGVRISQLNILFSVHRGFPPSWTLPSGFKLDLERRGDMHVLKGSYLTLKWPSRFAVPPSDNKVKITADLYDDTVKVAGPLEKIAIVEGDRATFTGNSEVPFNRVTLTIDLRDNK